MRIIAYTCEAAFHCPDCTKARFDNGGFSLTDPMKYGNELDENGISYAATDREGNNIGPVFSTDEINQDECCDDCFCPIKS